MKTSKILLNTNHVVKNAENEYSNLVDGFFFSSANLSSTKMLKLIHKEEQSFKEKVVLIDFFSYFSTSDVSQNNNLPLKEEINKRKIDQIILDQNLTSLFLIKKTNIAKELIKQSISSWVKIILNSRDDFYYALPLPLIGTGEIFKSIWKAYLEELREIKEKIKEKKIFVNIAFKTNCFFGEDTLPFLKELKFLFNINICVFSTLRTEEKLLTNNDNFEKVISYIKMLDDVFDDVFLNYLHYELPFLRDCVDNINLNYIFGTYEQTKLFSPKIKWMNEKNYGNFKSKIFIPKLCIEIKQSFISFFSENKEAQNWTRNEVFKNNINNLKKVLMLENKILNKNVLENLENVKQKEGSTTFSKFNIIDWIHLFKISNKK